MDKLGTYLTILLILTGLLRVTQAANCHEKVADIVFILDSSVSIRQEDFQRQLTFVENIVDNFKIGDNNIQMGCVTFSDNVTVNFHLNDHHTKDGLKSALRQIPYVGGGTNTTKALLTARTKMFKPEHGGREWASKIIVLITDGISNSVEQYKKAHEQAFFAKYLNITVLAIGVGNDFRVAELEGLASEPSEKYVYRVGNFQALNTIRNELSINTCENPQNDQKSTESLEPEKNVRQFCGGKPADVYFLLDSSSSIHITEFRQQLRFVSDVIDVFDISETKTRVGVALYSDRNRIKMAVPLKNSNDKEILKHHVKHLRRLTGNTDTAFALEHLRTYGFRKGVARSGVAHVIILLTDGRSTDPRATALEASLAKKEGIIIFTIGIGDMTSADELMTIANDPDENFVFRVDNFKALRHIRNILAIKTCNVEVTQNDRVTDQLVCMPHGPRDIMFVFDGVSLGLGKSYILRKAIGKITKNMGLESRKDQRVGVMSEVHPHDADARLSAIEDQIIFEEKLESLNEGKLENILRRLRHHTFLPSNGGRPEVEHVAVLFLDKTSEITPEVIHIARRASSKIKLYVVVIGLEGSVQDADRICSEPSDRYLTHVPSYEDMSLSTLSIAKQLCLND